MNRSMLISILELKGSPGELKVFKGHDPSSTYLKTTHRLYVANPLNPEPKRIVILKLGT